MADWTSASSVAKQALVLDKVRPLGRGQHSVLMQHLARSDYVRHLSVGVYNHSVVRYQRTVAPT